MKKTIVAFFLIILVAVIITSFLHTPAKISKEPAIISGIVTDTNGIPLAGVEVTARSMSMGSNLYRFVCPTTWSDVNGLYNLTLDFPDIIYSVVFQYGKDDSIIKSVIPNETKELNITFGNQIHYKISGTVSDGRNFSPVSGAKVKRYYYGFPDLSTTTTSDEYGKFEIYEIKPGRNNGFIYAKKDNKVSSAISIYYEDNIELKINEGAELSGTVTLEKTNEPVENCTVSIKTTLNPDCFSFQTKTDAKGKYLFSHIPPTEYDISVRNQNYFESGNKSGTAKRILMRNGNKYNYNFKVYKKAAFEGIVVDRFGNPVSNAIVAVYESQVSKKRYPPAPVRTDNKGKFSIATGRININPKPKARGLRALKQFVQGFFIKKPAREDAIEAFSSIAGYGKINFSPYNEGEIVKGLKIKLSGTIGVHGKVTDNKGNPLEGVYVSDLTGIGVSAYTDDKGEFDLGKIPILKPSLKQGTISFLAPRPEMGIITFSEKIKYIKDIETYAADIGFFHHKELKYNIKPGKDVEINVTLEPTDLVAFYGNVTDINNTPVENVEIDLFTGNAEKEWVSIYHPNPFRSYRLFSASRGINKTKTDKNGSWEIVIARDNEEGIRLNYYTEAVTIDPKPPRNNPVSLKNIISINPNLFSIGVYKDDNNHILIQDIIIDKDTTEKEINIKL
jgi:protocatechuate 3,4-dioxygenase beta subunit